MISHRSEPSGDPSDETLARYLSNELPLDERHRVQQWISATPERREMIALMYDVWADPARTLDAWDRDRLIAAFGAATTVPRATAPRATVMTPRPPATRWTAWRGVMTAAAAIAIAVAIIATVARGGMAAWHAWTQRAHNVAAGTPEWKYNTGAGQRATIQLADGSAVVLGPRSRLAPAAGFGSTSRAIYLEGEAYFDVQGQPSLPFIVNTTGSATRVLGTTFGIRRYASDTATRIAVVHGRVAVDAVGTTTVLSAGDLTVVPESGRAMVVHDPAAVDMATAWHTGRLSILNVPLQTAVDDIARWYDLDIHITDDSLARRKITVSLPEPRDVTVLLHTIADALDARVERVGRTVTFSTR